MQIVKKMITALLLLSTATASFVSCNPDKPSPGNTETPPSDVSDVPSVDFKGNGSIGNDSFFLEFNSYTGGINKMVCQADETYLNYVMGTDHYSDRNTDGNKWFGDVDISVSFDGGKTYREISTSFSGDVRVMSKAGRTRIDVTYTGDSQNVGGLDGLTVHQTYVLNGEELTWETVIENSSGTDAILGAVSFPLMFNSRLSGTNEDMYEKYVYNHSYIGYHNTYFYACRNSGKGPSLLLYPKGDTSVEYQYWRGYENCASMYTVAGITQEQYPNSSYLNLSTASLPAGESVQYSFGMRWADTLDEINNELYEAGKTGIVSLPGMVTSTDLPVSLALRSKKKVKKIQLQYEDETEVRVISTDPNDHQRFRISFAHLGENTVTFEYEDGTKAALLYFVTEPLAELIEKNTTFISENQHQTDPNDECYMGFLPWDMVMADKTGDGLLDEGNNQTYGYFPTGWWHYGGDEMGYSPALYLSLKNVYDPDETQIKQLVDYINIFIYGKMTERFPDGSYRLHRGAPWYIMGEWEGDPRIDKEGIDSNADCWRSYNYPHVINTYYNMYRIASYYDFEIEGMLDANEYLKRAYDLMHTFFTKWMYPRGDAVRGEGGIHFGNMGETMFFEIAEALKDAGMLEEYAFIKEQLDLKAAYFAEEAYPYSSESYFDTAAYESVFAYALYSNNKVLADEVTATNIATRGRTPVWYLYGSDLPSQDKAVNLRYMTQLGGWSILLHALNYAEAPQSELRLAYGSYLAGWSLINSGYYSDKPYNIGSSVWYYQGIRGNYMDSVNDWEKILPVYQGAVAVSGESALGFWAGLSMASTIVTVDDIFGLYAYGGIVSQTEAGKYAVVLKDGVQKRLHLLLNEKKITVEAYQDRIASAIYDEAMTSYRLEMINASQTHHASQLTVSGLENGKYTVSVNGNLISTLTTEDGTLSIAVNTDAEAFTITIEKAI